MRARLKLTREDKEEQKKIMATTMARFSIGTLVSLVFLVICTTDVLATEESRIEEVTQPKLEKRLESKGFVAVYWYSRNCKKCEAILEDLETIDDDAAKSNVELVKLNDKRYAKTFGIIKFPALSILRGNDIVLYQGDLSDEEEVLEFLTDEDNMSMPDNIEDVNAEMLLRIIEEDKFVTVLFYDESKKSSKALDSLENIDDETDVFGIRFIRINDPELADDYSLTKIPCLVYFRNEIPIVYAGDLEDSEEVLEWLIKNQSSADDVDVVENVGEEKLEIMAENVDQLMILFYDNTKRSAKILDILETIDDDCDRMDVSFVAVKDKTLAAKYNIDEFPTLVFFENQIPSIFDEDLEKPDEVMSWIVDLTTGADIEQVTNEILDKFIRTKSQLVVLFFREDEDKSTEALNILEEIDDDLDEQDIVFVKIDDAQEASEYGIENFPTLVLFENGIPNMFDGIFDNGEDILLWIISEASGDHTIETVTDNMLDILVSEHDHVAVLFFDKGDTESEKVLEALEQIDDDIHAYEFPIKMLRIDDPDEAREYGIDTIPALVYFDKKIPNIYDGSLEDIDAIVGWLTSQATGSHIEDVSDELLNMLIKKHDDVTVFFYDKEVKQEVRLLEEFELVDHLLEEKGIPLIKMDNAIEAEKHGAEVIPAIVHFQFGEAHVYKGDLTNERKIVQWILDFKNIK